MTEATETTTPPPGLAGTWAILELMGHQSIAGWVTEVQIAGRPMLRVDVPKSAEEDDEPAFTRYYSASALYAVTPCSESAVRQYVDYYRPNQAPVHLPPEPSLLTAAVLEGEPDEEMAPF